MKLGQIVVFYSILVLTNCGVSNHKTHNYTSDNNDFLMQKTSIKIPEINEIIDELSDTIYTCPSKMYSLVYSPSKRQFIKNNGYRSSMNCLCKDAFINYNDAEAFLSLYFLTSFNGMPCHRFRGEVIFTLALKYLPNYTVRNPEMNKFFFESYRNPVYNMIKSIDGINPTSYYIVYLRKIKKMSDTEMAKIMDNDKMTWMKLEYEALVFAWENELITLKDYGEE